RSWTQAFSMSMHFDIHSSRENHLPVRVVSPVFRRYEDSWEWLLSMIPLSSSDTRNPSGSWYVFLTDTFFVDVAIDGNPAVIGPSIFSLEADQWKRLKLDAPTAGGPVLGFVWGPLDLVDALRACPLVDMEESAGRVRLSGQSPFG